MRPRWVGLNLLAPTYRHSVTLLSRLDEDIRVMLGGHQAKAMPTDILADMAIPRIDALVYECYRFGSPEQWRSS